MSEIKEIELNERFKEALELIESGENVFITGKAGTGKSTLLSYFTNHTKKRVVVLAPTGVAALNVKGQTIHSFFHFKPDITINKVRQNYKNKDKKGLMKKIDTIVIDEISMVRADLLDCVDEFLRLNGPKKQVPFGGIQMVFIGDLYQLPPVVTGAERSLFSTVYDSPYFFSSKAAQTMGFTLIELEKIYRQKDIAFIEVLNKIRNNSVEINDVALLNRQVNTAFKPDQNDLYMYLTPTNSRADQVNSERLSLLSSKLKTYEGNASGEFDSKTLPTRLELSLKVGAQIMFVNNDQQGQWVNGTIGRIKAIGRKQNFETDVITVELQDGSVVSVSPHTWEMFRYIFNSVKGILDTETIGTFTQYPIMLAWAVTIHKSQGKTFDKVIIDFDRGTFAHGQAYVALSRCTSLEGMVLKRPLEKKHIWVDWKIMKFHTGFQYELSEKTMSLAQKTECIARAIAMGTNLEIVYLKANDTKSTRTIKPSSLGTMTFRDKEFFGVEAYCLERKDTRVFRVDRILELH